MVLNPFTLGSCACITLITSDWPSSTSTQPWPIMNASTGFALCIAKPWFLRTLRRR